MNHYFFGIFEYQHHYNQKLAEQLATIEGNIDPGIRALFSHILNAHQIWNARINGTPTLGVKEVHTYEKCRDLDLVNYKTTREILAESDLEAPVIYQNSKGKEFKNSIRDILFHVSNHTTHHRGQIVLEIRNAGFEPVVTDYIFYKRS